MILAKNIIIGSYVRKLLSTITFPEFSIPNTWRGASEIIAEFRFEFSNNFSVMSLFQSAPAGANFCPCVAWKPTADTIVRYKLWNNVGEILYVPLYSGQTIGSNFSLEIWNINSSPAIGVGYELLSSILSIPVDYCETDDRTLGLDYELCTDVTFDLTDFVPIDGDYYVVIGDCGLTQLIKGNVVVVGSTFKLQSTDLTWHNIGVVDVDGSLLMYVDQDATTPGDDPFVYMAAYSPSGFTYHRMDLELLEGSHHLRTDQDSTVTTDFINSLIFTVGSDLHAMRLSQIEDIVQPAVDPTIYTV